MASALPEFSSAPQQSDFGLVYSKETRQAAGIPSPGDHWNYIDAYNQARMAEYNNAYNYWLWRQQAEYNSPSNQVARLREAGLNPNFNSIDGTGNLGNMPTSSGSMSPSIGRNRASNLQANMSAVLGVTNSLVNAFGQGVHSFSELSDLPPLDSMKQYRKLVLSIAQESLRSKQYDNFERAVNGLINLAGGSEDIGTFSLNVPYFSPVERGGVGFDQFITFDPSNHLQVRKLQQTVDNMGLDFNIKNLVAYAKQFTNEHILPSEAAIKEGNAGMATAGTVIKQIADGNMKDLTFSQVLMAIIVLSLSH